MDGWDGGDCVVVLPQWPLGEASLTAQLKELDWLERSPLCDIDRALQREKGREQMGRLSLEVSRACGNAREGTFLL